MTIRTIDRHKIGTIEHRAFVRYIIPVTDTSPNQRTDIWIEDRGYTDDWEQETFTTLPEAEKWITRRCTAKLVNGIERTGAEISVMTWVPDEFEDPISGETVLDATAVEEERRYYNPDNGTLEEVIESPGL